MSSLENGIRILQCFSAERSELRVSEVAEHLGLPKSTVSRLMKTLAESGLIEPDPKRRGYGPGILAFELGNYFQKRLKLLDLVDEALSRLVDEYHATGYIGVLNGADIVLIRVRQGSYPVRLVLEPGYRGQAFATTIGRVLMARLPDAEVRALHPDPLSHPEAEYETDIDSLLSDLANIRRDGVAATFNTNFSGFCAIGCAVESADEPQAVAFSLSFPTSAADDEIIKRMKKSMLVEACEIGRRVKDKYWQEFRSVPEFDSKIVAVDGTRYTGRIGSIP
ncbi:IclR family transcriptional regulator [Oceanibacterium hippocampi]|uniref:Acetate operon repressor n=1 Tax=Oceanibacterium hippocampi TaxID=745714 RepID=A0A1Y5TLH2_9PROT|nr:IclR family transcriptional regulator [Oceanibacterium hippocampi]SLN64825.1 Acetate operon repressor [Oceanibacterium hippocampi]